MGRLEVGEIEWSLCLAHNLICEVDLAWARLFTRNLNDVDEMSLLTMRIAFHKYKI